MLTYLSYSIVLKSIHCIEQELQILPNTNPAWCSVLPLEPLINCQTTCFNMILPDPSHMSCHIKAEKIDKGAESLSFAKAMKDTKSLDTYASDGVKATEVKEVSMKAFFVYEYVFCSQDER